MSSSAASNDIVVDLPAIIKVYKDGKVERIWGTPHVQPSLHDPITGVSSKDITISPHVSARLYLPKLKSPDIKLPVLVYYHCGGFCVDSAFSQAHHRYLNTFASEACCLGVSVEYRLAPEHLLPAAFDDSWTALQWVVSRAGKDLADSQEKDPWLTKHGDFRKFFIGGDSAGATIVHNMLFRAGTEGLHGGVKISGAILDFPFFWGSKPVGGETVGAFEEYLRRVIKKMWDLVYPAAPGGIDCPLFNPFVEGAPTLKGLACSKMFVCTAEKDELRGRAIFYVECVKKSGWNGEIELVDVEGEGHCFQLFNVDSSPENAKELITRIAHFIIH